MAKVAPLQATFNRGEFTPLLYGRVDVDQYKGALAKCLNHIPLVQGPLTRRPGTKFVAEVKNSDDTTRLVRFEFSTTQAYILEFGDLYFRVYKDHGQIVDGSSNAVEVTTPYSASDVAKLRFAQSNDTLYVAHPDHAPRKITRTSHTAWTIETIDFLDGPYLVANTTSTTLGLSATTGSVTVTASAVTGINGGDGFQSTDVGRLIRWKDAAGNWTWLKITARTSTTVVTATIEGADASATTATTNWRLGLWCDTLGYPVAVTFFEDRLGWGGAAGAPGRFDLSQSGLYETMAPSDADGTVADDDAVSYTLGSTDVQNIMWMIDNEKGLLVGTVSGEWLVRPSTQGEALTPTNVKAAQSTDRGSADVPVVRAGKAVLFIQRAGRKLCESAYVYEDDGFRAPDMTIYAQHITTGGMTDLAYQREPQSIVWAVRDDGTLLGFTYERTQSVLGWHRHTLGGASDADGTAAKVESIAVIPAPDGTRDEIWMIVQRYIDGATKRYIEYMTKLWERGDDQTDAFFVDCGLTYDSTAATTITGLDHLEGETVTILADGATHPAKTVSGGAITLDRSASTVQIGYGYNSDAQMLRLDVGAANGTALGKTQRSHRVAFLLHDSLGIQVGRDFDNLIRLPFRTSADDLGAAVPLFSGIKDDFTWEGDYTTDNYVCWRFDQPLPGTVLAVMPQLLTQDR